jgi:hypothetical protein
VQAAQYLHVSRGRLAHRLEGASPFEQRHHREELVGIVFRELGDLATLAWHECHEAFGGQHLERFAQRRAADLPVTCEGELVDPLAGDQLPLEHHRAQPGRHFFME